LLKSTYFLWWVKEYKPLTSCINNYRHLIHHSPSGVNILHQDLDPFNNVRVQATHDPEYVWYICLHRCTLRPQVMIPMYPTFLHFQSARYGFTMRFFLGSTSKWQHTRFQSRHMAVIVTIGSRNTQTCNIPYGTQTTILRGCLVRG
jgi:hypothetical protein